MSIHTTILVVIKITKLSNLRIDKNFPDFKVNHFCFNILILGFKLIHLII